MDAPVGMTRRTRVLLTLLALVVLFVLGTIAFRSRTPAELQAGETAETDVLVRAVRRLDRPTYVAVSGEVQGRRTVNVGFQVAGVVASVGPEEGDAVAAGSVLAQIDSEGYELGLQAATAQADHARDAFSRAKQMYDEKSLPPANYVEAETALRQAQAQEGLARKQVTDTRLLAPLKGVIAHRGIQPGEMASPGMPVFTIIAVDPVEVRVGVPEAEIGRIRTGQESTIAIPALNGETFEGRVRIVGIAADPVSRTYSVRISVPNPKGRLRPGMIAEAQIRDGGTTHALTLPGEAIQRDPAGAPFVYVFDKEDGRVHSRGVTVGSVIGREVEITAGLEGDEQVVVGGQNRLRSGDTVTARTVELSDSTSGGV
jgi:RND family efflux transporter MFP subunit